MRTYGKTIAYFPIFIRKLFFVFLFCPAILLAQDSGKETPDEDAAFLIAIDYGYNLSGGDLKTRFGPCFKVGGQLSYLLKNSSWQIGLKGSYYFGDTVKQDVLHHLRDNNGHIIGINGDYAQVKLRPRAFEIGMFASKVFSFGQLNMRSGIRVDLGLNLFQHWIRLQDDYNTVAQFNDPYDKGYDRLTNGLALTEFIGYQYMSNDRKVNFYAGFELLQAMTKSRRDYDYATQTQDTSTRMDFFSGFKVGWILPIYLESQPDELYY